MIVKAIVSTKGQLVILKSLRAKLGVHSGSKLTIELKDNNHLEIHPVKKEIKSFFGMGKNKGTKTSIRDIDNLIAKAFNK